MTSISIRTYTLTTNNGVELGTFAQLDELAHAFVDHFGKGYTGLAKKLTDALAAGKDTKRIEFVLGVSVKRSFMELAA